MAEPIRPLSNEIPRRNPSADNAIGTEGGDIGGNRGTNSRTRGLRLEGKAKRGARFVRSAKTEQISTRWKRRSRIDFVVNWKSSCGFFFLAKSSGSSSCIIRKTMERIFRIFDFVFFFFVPSFSFRDLFLPEINGKLKIRGRKLEISRCRVFFWDLCIFWIDWLLFIWSVF